MYTHSDVFAHKTCILNSHVSLSSSPTVKMLSDWQQMELEFQIHPAKFRFSDSYTFSVILENLHSVLATPNSSKLGLVGFV